jgi:hypothetical protein
MFARSISPVVFNDMKFIIDAKSNQCFITEPELAAIVSKA